MIGTVRWNLIVGLGGFLLTFFMSMSENFIWRALLHGMYSFLILFAVVYALRWVLGTLAGLKNVAAPNESADASAGQAVNETTPDDQEMLNQMLKDQLSAGSDDSFIPLQPKKLVSVSDTAPEKLAGALRQMKEE
ncbi:hypothetical protein [Paenibacillus ginsengarvi]|uniref:Uncharacterized protein n=1 Tax=Paenibacillus ginsengarvi TaxID=400777 RepID=A0A3B0CQ55_9BACL|nr:hypothetical protein [Paenibacillus ginsengarvi]RKN86498.1 hypothetical protein D7M11_00565 [Paenibacillus ginsengarvi]